MSNDLVSAEQKLVELLGSSAAYNDKGADWCRHAPGKVAEMQAEFQAKQLALAGEIGTARLGEALRSAIESGAAARDGSGEYIVLAEQALGIRRHEP